MAPPPRSMSASDWTLLAVLSVLWGGSFFFNGVILRELPPLTLVLLRVALASVILLPMLRVYGIGFPKGLSGWLPFLAIGLFNNVLPFSLIVIGPGSHGDFVPHLSVTVALALTAVDLGILIYFIHHTAKSIQLPEVIASIARDLTDAISAEP